MSPKLFVAMLKFAHALPTGLCLFSDWSFGSATAWYPRGWIWEEAPGDTAKDKSFVKHRCKISSLNKVKPSKNLFTPQTEVPSLLVDVHCDGGNVFSMSEPASLFRLARWPNPGTNLSQQCAVAVALETPTVWDCRAPGRNVQGWMASVATHLTPKTHPKHPKTKATTWDWKSHYYRVWRNAPDSRLVVECDSEVNEVCNLQSEPLGQQTTVLR